jgi:hypothetical protein
MRIFVAGKLITKIEMSIKVEGAQAHLNCKWARGADQVSTPKRPGFPNRALKCSIKVMSDAPVRSNIGLMENV